MSVDLQAVAERTREYCQTEQEREFVLEGACHENVLGAVEYILWNTDLDPVIVWGVVSHAPENETADTIEAVSETETHFWVEFENCDGIVDVYTNNPLAGDISMYVESGIAYGGERPECYNVVEKIRPSRELSSYDLCSAENFVSAESLCPSIERL